MAELETAPASDCCSPAAQETCCEPEAKGSCCGEHHTSGCGCSAGSGEAPEAPDVREVVRERYAAAAAAAAGERDASCCGNDAAVITDEQRDVFGSALYEEGERAELPDAAKRSPICTKGRRSLTSAREAASTCCSRPAESGRPGRRTGST